MEHEIVVSNDERKNIVRFFLLAILFAVTIIGIGAINLNFNIHVACAADNTTPKNPRIEIFPVEGPVNTQVFLRIWDYSSLKTVLVFFGTASSITSSTAAVCYTNTDESGYAVVSFFAGTIPGGRYMIVADDGFNKKTANFMIKPTITLANINGYIGDTITVSGNGFASKRPLDIYLDTTKIANGDTDSVGKFGELKFVLISCVTGKHVIKVQDSDGNSTTADYYVLPKMSSSPTAGKVGSQINLTGSGFPAKSINIYYDDQNIATAKVASNGNFSTNITAPICGCGTHKIKVDDGLDTLFSQFAVSPTITVGPLSGNVGTQVGIQGFGFTPGLPLTVSYDDKNMDTSPVNADGSLVFSFKIPKSKAGEHLISITDSVNTLKSTFVMESSPPLPPTLVSPLDSAKLVSNFDFAWDAVTDPSGVTYTIEISDDAKFENILLSQSNMVQCTYTISESDSENLFISRKIPYYWRIKATDGAYNVGAWSAIGSFYKAFTLDTVVVNMPNWTKLALVALGIMLIVSMLFLFVRVLKKVQKTEDKDEESAPVQQGEAADWDLDSESEE